MKKIKEEKSLTTQNNFNIFSFAKRISRPLILDGAMGSLLQQKKLKANDNLWMSYLNINNPEIILRIHSDYIKNGADIITTNTFRTNPVAFNKANNNFTKKIRNKDFVKAALDIAKESRKDNSVLIAGSNPPAEDSYQIERTVSKNDLIKNHHQHIEWLMEFGSDFILNETQSHFDEIKIISNFCYRNNIPYVISLFFTDELQILSGEKLKDIISYVLDYLPLAISFNCIMPSTMDKLFSSLNSNIFLKNNWGFYLNCGNGNYTDKNISCGVSPKKYIEYVKKSLKFKPSFIGSCCGSNSNHTKEIKTIIYG